MMFVKAITVIGTISRLGHDIETYCYAPFEQTASFNGPRYEAIYGEGRKLFVIRFNFNFMRLK